MNFKIFSNGKTILKISKEGLLINDSTQLISSKYLFFYTYNAPDNTYHHLMIQNGQNSWENFILFGDNELVSTLREHTIIYQKSFNPVLEEVSNLGGLLKNEDGTQVSWGPVKDTGSYSVAIKISYRKEFFVMRVHHSQIEKKLTWKFIEEIEIDVNPLQKMSDNVISYGVWQNNPEYWRKYYKQPELKDDNGRARQIKFLIIMVLIILWMIIWKFFLSE